MLFYTVIDSNMEPHMNFGTEWNEKFQSPKRKRIGVDGAAKKSNYRKTNNISGLSDSLDLTTEVVVSGRETQSISSDPMLSGPIRSSDSTSFSIRKYWHDWVYLIIFRIIIISCIFLLISQAKHVQKSCVVRVWRALVAQLRKKKRT